MKHFYHFLLSLNIDVIIIPSGLHQFKLPFRFDSPFHCLCIPINPQPAKRHGLLVLGNPSCTVPNKSAGNDSFVTYPTSAFFEARPHFHVAFRTLKHASRSRPCDSKFNRVLSSSTIFLGKKILLLSDLRRL